MKEKSYKERETEVTRGKRRYLERLEQTRIANEEIEDYENSTDERDTDGPHGIIPVNALQRSDS